MSKILNFKFLIIFVYAHFCSAQFNPSPIITSDFSPIGGDRMLNAFTRDFDGDGNLDIVLDGGMPYPASGTVYQSSNALVLLGDGAGSFKQSEKTIKKPVTHYGISDFADYNKDGNLDMIIYGFWANGFKIYDGTDEGLLTFSSPKSYSSGTHGYEARFVDFDNDNDLDIISVTTGSNAILRVHVYENINNTFSKSTYDYFEPAFISFFEFGDVNGDGRLDVLCPHLNETWVAIQQPNKTFEIVKVSNSGNFRSQLHINNVFKTWYDINNDGKSDLITIKESSKEVIGNLSLGEAPYFNMIEDVISNTPILFPYISTNQSSSDPVRFYTHDLDNDKVKDFVFVYDNQTFRDPKNDFIEIMLDPFNVNNKHQYIKIPLNKDCNLRGARGLVFGDFNNDGQDDISWLGKDNKMRTILTNIEALSTIDYTTIDPDSYKVFPQPVKNEFSIKSPNISSIKVYSIEGSLLKTIVDDFTSVDMSNFSNGFYLLKISTTTGKELTKKILVLH